MAKLEFGDLNPNLPSKYLDKKDFIEKIYLYPKTDQEQGLQHGFDLGFKAQDIDLSSKITSIDQIVYSHYLVKGYFNGLSAFVKERGLRVNAPIIIDDNLMMGLGHEVPQKPIFSGDKAYEHIYTGGLNYGTRPLMGLELRGYENGFLISLARDYGITDLYTTQVPDSEDSLRAFNLGFRGLARVVSSWGNWMALDDQNEEVESFESVNPTSEKAYVTGLMVWLKKQGLPISYAEQITNRFTLWGFKDGLSGKPLEDNPFYKIEQSLPKTISEVRKGYELAKKAMKEAKTPKTS